MPSPTQHVHYSRCCSALSHPISWVTALLATALMAIGETKAAGNAAGDQLGASTRRTPTDWILWSELPPVPDKLGMAGAYVGVSNGALIVAGGSNFPIPLLESGEKAYRDAIYVLEPGHTEWRNVGRLPQASANGAAVCIGESLICLGGRDARQVSDQVSELIWNSRSQKVDVQELTSLPQPCFDLAAAAIGRTIYVASGRNDAGPVQRFWSLRIQSSVSSIRDTEWQELPAYPAPARFGAALIAQSAGEHQCLYLLGGKNDKDYLNQVDRFDPEDNSPEPWQRCADMPRPAYLLAAAPWGQSHVFVFGGSSGVGADQVKEPQVRFQFPREALAYHTITDTWVHVGDLPQGLAAASAVKWNGGLAVPTGEVSPGLRTPEGFWGKVQTAEYELFGWLDQATIVGYLVALSAIGFYFTNKNRDTADFFLGGRRIPWWAAGLSLLATQVSSVGAMAIPAKSYAMNWIYFTGVATWFMVVPVVTSLFIPFFRRLNVTSAYEYLEARFSPAIRLIGSLSYCLLQLGRMAIVLYLPALALVSITGFEVIPTVLIMGVLCTIYTMAGGMQAVIWTEVLQAGVLLGGMLLCFVCVVWQLDGGAAEFLAIAASQEKFQIVHYRWDSLHASLWVVLIGNVFIRLSVLTSDQAVVQRYLTTRDERQARMALWTDVAVSIPWAFLVFSLGTALFVFYRTHPELLNPTIENDGIVPYFIAQQLPAGLSGLVVAAIMAAAMSTMESSMHSIATLLVTDVYIPLRPAASEASRLWTARVVTALLGVFGTACAILLARANVYSLWDFFQYLMGLFVGSLTGLFMLGVFTTRANSCGALVGALGSATLLACITRYTHVHFLLYSALGVLSCFAIGYVASLLVSGRSQTAGLTAYSILSEDQA